MTDTEAALLRAIAAHPDEDTPRLVFADYLDELGTPEAAGRAEFIRLHVRAAHLPPRDLHSFNATVDRIDQLLCAWDAVWQRDMPNGFRPLSGYRRGFPYRAAAPASAILAAADDPRLPPLESLTLTADVSANRLRELVRLPVVAGLKQLVVRSDVPIGWSGARALAEGEYSRLEELNLARQSIGDVGLRALCESWGFPRLRQLDLNENNITDDGARVLLESGLFRRLSRLSMLGNDLGVKVTDRLREGDRLW
jgi:uncharacterized protein (TIGR02996 family)